MSQPPPPLPPPFPPPEDQEVSPEDFAQMGAPRRASAAPIDPQRAGRWKKIATTVVLILTVLGIGYWIMWRAGFMGAIASADQPRGVAQEFVRLASEGSVESASRLAAPGFSYLQLQRHIERIRDLGSLQELTTWSSAMGTAHGTPTCRLEGVAVFADGEHPFSMELVREGETWKVAMVEID